jgi:hypothetical protein
MATTMPVLRARCPLCGSPAGGDDAQALDDDLHLIPLGPGLGLGLTLCDACGILADLPTNLTLN